MAGAALFAAALLGLLLRGKLFGRKAGAVWASVVGMAAGAGAFTANAWPCVSTVCFVGEKFTINPMGVTGLILLLLAFLLMIEGTRAFMNGRQPEAEAT